MNIGRGWTLQEQMLSPRVIHFTREELVWDYYGGQARECVDGGSAADVVKSRFGLALQNASLRSQAWREMLELYSSRQLTFHKDRLPAVSGVASEFAESTGAYHSGHWESELPFSLLWVCKYGPGERVKGTSDPPSNPPSWSWASMESTHISWQRWLRHNLNSDLVTVVEVLDVFTKPSTADPRGLVAKGMVTLRGKLYPLDFEGDKLCQPGHYEVAGLACAMQEDVPLSTIRSDMQRTGTQLHYLTIATSPTGNQGLYLLCHREVADGPDMPAQMSARTVGVGSLLRKADFNAYTTTTVGIS